MNRVHLALLAGVFASGAFAANDAPKTRVEVQKEAATATAKGEIASGDFSPMAKSAMAMMSKAEMDAVRAMVLAEAKLMPPASGDTMKMAKKVEKMLSKEQMMHLRAMILAEAAAAVRNGTLKTGDK